MRNLGPSYRISMTFEGHTVPVAAEELAQEHKVEFNALNGLQHHIAAYVPELFGSQPLPPLLPAKSS